MFIRRKLRGYKMQRKKALVRPRESMETEVRCTLAYWDNLGPFNEKRISQQACELTSPAKRFVVYVQPLLSSLSGKIRRVARTYQTISGVHGLKSLETAALVRY